MVVSCVIYISKILPLSAYYFVLSICFGFDVFNNMPAKHLKTISPSDKYLFNILELKKRSFSDMFLVLETMMRTQTQLISEFEFEMLSWGFKNKPGL